MITINFWTNRLEQSYKWVNAKIYDSRKILNWVKIPIKQIKKKLYTQIFVFDNNLTAIFTNN